jgi:N-acylneuraminate cytidylyltransferase
MSRTIPYVIAIIPARGGSKRIPRKNLLPIKGIPLVGYSIRHALQAHHVREVYVSTDDADIVTVARAYGAGVVIRPVELAGDQATSETALLHVLDDRLKRGLSDPELVVFLQPTSPVRRPNDIDHAIETLLDMKADSLFSACENNRLIWAMRDGQPVSLTYDFHSRQREQDMALQFRENGSIYVFRPEILQRYNNRLGGKIAIYEMDYWSSFQVDSPEHIELCEWVLRRPEYSLPLAWPDRIELVVFDFDGVMTDNAVWVYRDGTEAVRCDRSDGWGISQLRDLGIPMLVLSTEKDPVVSTRCAKLQLPYQQGIGNKAKYLGRYFQENKIDPSCVIYLGNDINDLGAMRMVGFPVAVKDSHPAILAAAKLVLTKYGGYGAVRELCELLAQRFSVRD